MNHDKARLLMSEYLDGRLGDDEVGALNDHLQTCPSCLSYWKALQRVTQVFQTAEVALPPPDFTARLMRRLNGETTRGYRDRQPSPFAWAAVAAAFVVLAAGVMLYALQLPTTGHNGPSADVFGLSMNVSRAVLLAVRLVGMTETIIHDLVRSIPTPVLLLGLLWMIVGILVLIYALVSLINACQPRRVATQHVKDGME